MRPFVTCDQLAATIFVNPPAIQTACHKSVDMHGLHDSISLDFH